MCIDLLMIAIIVCFIVDISGIIDSVKRMIWKWIFNDKKVYSDFRLKPFDCSLCLTFWIGLIWIIIKDFSLLNLVYLSVISALTENIGKVFILIRLSIGKLEDILIEIITRN